MALTIRMRIDDHDEHSYYYATGDGAEIELIPLVVNSNGVFEPATGKCYNKVTVNVPKVVELQNKTVTISANGSTSVSADSGYDGLGTVTMNTNVPNTYTQADEGKVVSNGALVAQTAHADVTPTNSDQTINTTLNNSIKVKGDADLVAGNIKKNVEIFGVTGSYEGGGGGTSNCDVAYFSPSLIGEASELIEIRQGKQPQAIHVFSAMPDSPPYSDANIIINYACCFSQYDGDNYYYDAVGESDNTGIGSTGVDFSKAVVLDGWVPTITPQTFYDVFGIDNGFLYGYVLDGNESSGYGLMGDYIVVVVYDVEPPVE